MLSTHLRLPSQNIKSILDIFPGPFKMYIIYLDVLLENVSWFVLYRNKMIYKNKQDSYP